jgi:hypothetical protein
VTFDCLSCHLSCYLYYALSNHYTSLFAQTAAYEVPGDIIIADLVDEYDSEMNWGPSGDIGSSYGEDYDYDVDFEAEDEEQPLSNYGLRGSSFDEDSDANNEKWKACHCKAEKRAAVWEQRMKEWTGEAREEAKERFAEAKAASAKAWARISKDGKSAWDAVKNESTSIGKSIVKETETWGEKAAHWFERNDPFENEDEYEDEEMLRFPPSGWNWRRNCRMEIR